jgi:hypothetical protein
VSPFPINLRMIAGDATAVEIPQITQIYRYPTREARTSRSPRAGSLGARGPPERVAEGRV